MSPELREAIYRAAVAQLKRDAEAKFFAEALAHLGTVVDLAPLPPLTREWLH